MINCHNSINSLKKYLTGGSSKKWCKSSDWRVLVIRLATELLSVDDLEINLIQSRREEIEPQLIEKNHA